MAYIDIRKLYEPGRNASHIKTSSLNSYCICHNCDKRLKNKRVIIEHLKTCMENRTCSWCNITFKNRGNLTRHAFYVHGDKSAIKPHSLQNTCEVCSQSFPDPVRLLFHIRSVHFNLKAKIMPYEDKEINQVWFEKVYNSSKVVEIKKAAHNLLLIRKLEDDTKVTIQEANETDLSEMYPTCKKSATAKCRICHLTYLKRDLKKHYDEKHMQIKKHHCNNCNKSFKRSVIFVRHVCHKDRRKRRLVL